MRCQMPVYEYENRINSIIRFERGTFFIRDKDKQAARNDDNREYANAYKWNDSE